jgi:protein O-GlcNAc transferase
MLLTRLFRGMRSSGDEFARGTAAVQAGRMEEGIIALRRALELTPGLPGAHFNLGVAYRSLGNPHEALAAFRRAAELAPGFAEAHQSIGSVLREQRELEEAERSLRTALALKPDLPEALLELGHVHRGTGDWRAAIDAFRRAVSVDPGFARARWAATVAQIPAVDDADTDRDERRRAFAGELEALEAWFASARDPEALEAVAVQQPFYLAYHEVSNRELLARYGRLCASLMQRWQQDAGLAPPPPTRNSRGADGRIRVGIVSGHLYYHSVWSALVRGWVQRLDRDRFELHLFHLSGRRDAETERAVSLATSFHQAKGGFEYWARFIHGSGMDVLIYPEIGMDPTTARLASMRLAPVQVTSWGHPETSGLPTIDHYLSAQAFEPPDAQAHYSEALEPLPGTGCWLPRDADAARDAQPPQVPEAKVRMICAGTPFKYAAAHDALFVEIARRVPGGRLVFFRSFPEALSHRLERRLRAAFDRAGLAFDRHATFLPLQEGPAFRALLAASDLYLDTIGFSGFNTALQALNADLPVVTREGLFMRGRLASGTLRHIGLDELVAPSDAAYVELAVALANDAGRRQRMRERIREARGRLFEDDAPIRALEGFLVRVARAP